MGIAFLVPSNIHLCATGWMRSRHAHKWISISFISYSTGGFWANGNWKSGIRINLQPSLCATFWTVPWNTDADCMYWYNTVWRERKMYKMVNAFQQLTARQLCWWPFSVSVNNRCNLLASISPSTLHVQFDQNLSIRLHSLMPMVLIYMAATGKHVFRSHACMRAQNTHSVQLKKKYTHHMDLDMRPSNQVLQELRMIHVSVDIDITIFHTKSGSWCQDWRKTCFDKAY